MSDGASTTAVASLDQQPETMFRRAMLLATLTFVTMLYAMTVTIANVSLPQMQGSLSSSPDQIAWIVTFNIVATAVVTPIAGWLTMALGRRRLIIWSVVGFGVSSILCGLATSVTDLVIYRIAQGAFGAPLVPVSQAIVLETFPERQRSRVMSIWGTGVILGPIIAPAIGGALSEAYNWRWVFFMLVPFTVVALIGVLAFIRNNEKDENPALDWTGFIALVASITTLQLMLDRGERAGWFEASEIIIYAGICAATFYIFVVRNLMAEKPFLNPALLRDRNFVVGLVLIFIFGMLNFTPITLLPTLLQNIQGFPDSVIGQILSARGAGTFIGFVSMFIFGRIDLRIPMTVGLGLQAYSGWMMAGFDVNVTFPDVLWASAIQGLGVGLVWIPLSLVAFMTLPKALMPDGTAIFHLLRNMGSSVFISLSVALVIRETQYNYAELVPNLSPYNKALRMPDVPENWQTIDPSALAAMSGEIGRQATMIGYLNAFVLFAAVAAMALPLVGFVRVNKSG
ncbi:MAG: DHA2 family efflux MFS transporter permease subunit [Geminicoccaceae bacterium]